MSGHLHEINGDKFLVVTKTDRESEARDVFRKVFGSTANIYKVKYLSFVHCIQD